MPERSSGYRRTPRAAIPSVDSKGVINSEIFALVKGRTFGSWITADGRSVGYAAGDLIENPAYIIESILRDAVGLTASSLNLTSIDALGNTTTGRRNGWKFAASIFEQANSLDIVSEICQEAAMFVVNDYANTIRLVAIDHYSPTLELNTTHIAKERGRPIVRVRQTHPKSIKNEFYLNYRVNYGSGNRDRQLFITDASHNLSSNVRNDKTPFDTYTGLCTQSKSMYNLTSRWTFDSKYIRDDVTAELFIKAMADWLALRKWEVQASLLYSADALSIESLDQVLWNIDLLPVSVRNAAITMGETNGLIDVSPGLAVGTHYWVVAPVDNYGEGKKSAEVSFEITGANQGVRLVWFAMPGATKYRIYGRITGAQDQYWETTDTTFDDTGAAGTAGTPKAVAPAFFATRIVDDGLRGGQLLKMEFVACPTIFFLGGGFGYGFGELFGVQL